MQLAVFGCQNSEAPILQFYFRHIEIILCFILVKHYKKYNEKQKTIHHTCCVATMTELTEMTRSASSPPVAAGLCFLPQSVICVVIVLVKGLAGNSSILKLPEDIKKKKKNVIKAVAHSTELQCLSSQTTWLVVELHHNTHTSE